MCRIVFALITIVFFFSGINFILIYEFGSLVFLIDIIFWELLGCFSGKLFLSTQTLMNELNEVLSGEQVKLTLDNLHLLFALIDQFLAV